MARVPYLDVSDLAPDDRDLLKRPINLFRALVHSPGAARGWSRIGQYIRHGSKLDPRLREMAILQVGYVARAPYEWSHHVKIGHDFGVSDDDIRAIIAETEGHATTLDPFDKIVLKAAREMASGLAICDATFAALREKLDTALLTDLVLTIAFYCAVVRVLATMQIDVEDDYMPYLKQFPLPKN
jgi:alkylhydroperoxidase family enzyme